jgi:cholestenol delta-isomerase
MFDHYYKEVTYSRPEFLYFWGYYFFMNFIWMVFPGCKWIAYCSNLTGPEWNEWLTSVTVLLVSSVRTIARAMEKVGKETRKTNGAANGSAKKTN